MNGAQTNQNQNPATMTTANAPLQSYFAALLSGAAMLVGDCCIESVEIVQDNAHLIPTRMVKTPRPKKQPKAKLEEYCIPICSLPSRWETAAQTQHVPRPSIPTRKVSVELLLSDEDVSNHDDNDESVTDRSSSSIISGSSDHGLDDSAMLSSTRWMTDSKLQSSSPKCPERRPYMARSDSLGSLTKQTKPHGSPLAIGRCT